MPRRTLIGMTAATFVVAMALAARGPAARAEDRPETWSAAASSAGVRISVEKPAALPTSDQVVALELGYAHAETDSSPIGRAIGSWLWPGDTVAEAKSLLLVGLDPSAAQSEQNARKKRHPGTDGCQPERMLGTPEVPDPNGGPPLAPAVTVTNPLTGEPLEDPTDNPCGEAAVRTALQTLAAERAPDYPFWAHSQYPANRARDTHDTMTLCTTSAAFPSNWQLPTDACPAGAQAPRTGYADARSDDAGDWGTAQLSAIDIPGIAHVGSVSSLARTEWQGSTLVAATSVTLHDVTIFGAGGTEFLHAASITSQASVASAGAGPTDPLSVEDLTVTLGGTRYRARVERNRVEIADQRLPDAVQNQISDALDAAMTSQGQTISFGDVQAGGGVAGALAPATFDPATNAAKVAGLEITLEATDEVEGSTTVHIDLAVAEAQALTRAQAVAIPPPSGGTTYQPGIPGVAAIPPHSATLPFATTGTQARQPAALAAPGGTVPESHPVPVAVIVLVFFGALIGVAAMVAAGIWETIA